MSGATGPQPRASAIRSVAPASGDQCGHHAHNRRPSKTGNPNRATIPVIRVPSGQLLPTAGIASSTAPPMSCLHEVSRHCKNGSAARGAIATRRPQPSFSRSDGISDPPWRSHESDRTSDPPQNRQRELLTAIPLSLWGGPHPVFPPPDAGLAVYHRSLKRNRKQANTHCHRSHEPAADTPVPDRPYAANTRSARANRFAVSQHTP